MKSCPEFAISKVLEVGGSHILAKVVRSIDIGAVIQQKTHGINSIMTGSDLLILLVEWHRHGFE